MLNLNKTDLKEEILIIQNDDGSIQCIPEDGATADEKMLFEEFRQAFPNGKPVQKNNIIPIVDPVDEEKVAMAKAIIDLEIRLSALENK